jgi:AraC-like DNA-binding protein
MRAVAVLAYDGVSTFGLGVTAEVFGCDRSGDGLPLECTDAGIEQVAAECGLTALMLRRHFARRLGVTPQDYRRRFSQLAS